MKQTIGVENWLEFLLQHAEEETQTIFEMVNEVLENFNCTPSSLAA